MAVLATDILIKSMLEAAIADLRKNSWILDDIFSGLATDTITSVEYGYKEAAAAKEWFINNDIPVYLGFRNDQPTMPCISVVQQGVSEDLSRTSLADQGMIGEMNPELADRPIQKVIPDFTPVSYNSSTRLVTLPDQHSTDIMAEGMYLLTRSGKSYIVEQIVSGRSFIVADDITASLTGCCIVPASSLWNVHRELTYLSENYSIGLHVVSQPHFGVWLRQLAIYILLRYKEALLEGRGFELSTFNVMPMQINSVFDMDRVFSTYINLSGIVQADWIKFIAPKLARTTAIIKVDKVKPLTDLEKIMTPEAYVEQVKSQTWRMQDDVFADTWDNDSEGLEVSGLVEGEDGD